MQYQPCFCGFLNIVCRSSELQSARETIETLQQELAEVQRTADDSEGRIMELCEGTDSLNQELQAAKAHIARQADEKEHMQRVSAVQAQQLAERASALEDCEAQKNQANESLALIGQKMDELEEKLAAQDKTIAKTQAMYKLHCITCSTAVCGDERQVRASAG